MLEREVETTRQGVDSREKRMAVGKGAAPVLTSGNALVDDVEGDLFDFICHVFTRRFLLRHIEQLKPTVDFGSDDADRIGQSLKGLLRLIENINGFAVS